VYPWANSGSNAFYYGQEATCNYATGSKNSGSLTSPLISGVSGSATLSFSYWRQVEFFANGSYDQASVQVSYDGGSTWTTVWSEDCKVASENAWQMTSVSLSPANSSLLVRFVFNTVDSLNNNFKGWLIDDVTVTNH
jgi:hypothetical protein